MPQRHTPTPRLLFSELLSRTGVPHAFTTRIGGVSTGVFDSLNFGNPGELSTESRDPWANISENFGLVARSIGADGRELTQVHQVHGAAVHVVGRGAARSVGSPDVKADAIVTDDSARLLAVRTADCTPILISTIDGRCVAAVHAGWRGVIADVVIHAVRALRQLHGDAGAALVAAIGPCIGPERFEVGPEVAAEFAARFGAGRFQAARGERVVVDLQAAIQAQLTEAGLAPGQIQTLPCCTVGRPDLFFSHRRDGGLTGRMASLISPRE